MCGINGIFSIGNSLPANVDVLIANMNSCIRHRGPDDNGVFIDRENGIALGHQRLSIIDLTFAGHQPMIDDHGNVIVFNGEIYNYKELKSLEAAKHFQTGSDTEVLMSLLNKSGEHALNSLNGMFAFAWFHKQKNELFLARDRAGKKPIYYSTSSGYFAFSSEVKALLTLPWIKKEPDNEALYNFLTFNHLDAPQTMFKGIYKMAPAECLRVTPSGIAEKKIWWESDYKNLTNVSESDLADEIFHELDKSVALRMVADVPVGAFLSGGVDSSAVVALMREHSTSTIKTFSVGFKDQPDYDERKYAEKVSNMFNTEHYEKLVSHDDIAELLPKVVEIFDEPMADATCIPIYFISKLARENGTIVVQTGDGADELFAGYRNWQKYDRVYPYYHTFSSLPTIVRKSIAQISGLLNEESPIAEILHRGSRKQELFWGGAKAFKENTKKDFLQPNWLAGIEQKDSYEVIKKHKEKFNALRKKNSRLNDIDWMCYLGFHFQVPNKYLYRMDRLGMANSIEIRSPFLDYNLINLALSIPSNLKIKNEEPKYILKKSLERILPSEILYRKKMGFCVPLREWAHDIMFDFVEQNMHSFCKDTGIFREDGLKLHLEEIKSGNKQLTNNLWTVYFLMSWFKKWM